jgi:hypothetical protein
MDMHCGWDFQTDGEIDRSAVDDLALDLVLSPMRRTHRRAIQ